MKTFDKDSVRLISNRIQEALQPLAKELGVAIRSGRGTYSNSNFTLKVEVSTIGESGQPKLKEAESYRQLAMLYGLPEDGLDKTFMHNGNEFAIAGLNTRAQKMPVLARNTKDGKIYKFGVDTVRRLLVTK